MVNQHPKDVIVFDLGEQVSLAHKRYAGEGRILSPAGKPIGGLYGVFDFVVGLRRVFPSGMLVGVWGARRRLGDVIAPVEKDVLDMVHSMGVMSIETDGESEDLVASIAIRAKAEGRKCVIVSPSPIYSQLITKGLVSWLDKVDGTVVGYGDAIEMGGIDPGLLPDYWAVVGNTELGIKGLPGCGELTGKRLISTGFRVDGCQLGNGPIKSSEDLEMVTAGYRRGKLAGNVDPGKSTRGKLDIPAVVSILEDVGLFREADSVRHWGPLFGYVPDAVGKEISPDPNSPLNGLEIRLELQGATWKESLDGILRLNRSEFSPMILPDILELVERLGAWKGTVVSAILEAKDQFLRAEALFDLTMADWSGEAESAILRERRMDYVAGLREKPGGAITAQQMKDWTMRRHGPEYTSLYMDLERKKARMNALESLYRVLDSRGIELQSVAKFLQGERTFGMS